ncbi:MAG: Bifunctional protein HldE [Syntrophomonadaceae bacterium]|nr:Bifunctional protein HldE [Bacillota bacterium]
MKRRIGFVCSAFDLFHAGHVLMLEEAKQQCDHLIVGLQTDPTLDRPHKNKPV